VGQSVSTPTYQKNKRLLFRVVDDEALILDLDVGEYYGLNAVATRVWDLLGNGEPFESVIEVLLDEFDVAAEQVTADLEQLTSELLAARLLVETEAGFLDGATGTGKTSS